MKKFSIYNGKKKEKIKLLRGRFKTSSQRIDKITFKFTNKKFEIPVSS